MQQISYVQICPNRFEIARIKFCYLGTYNKWKKSVTFYSFALAILHKVILVIIRDFIKNIIYSFTTH